MILNRWDFSTLALSDMQKYFYKTIPDGANVVGPIAGKDGHRDTEEWVAVRFAPRGLKRSYLPLHARTTRSVRRIKSALVSYRWERIRSPGCISSHTTAYVNLKLEFVRNVNVNEIPM